MKFSKIQEVLRFKYRDGEDPKITQKRKNTDIAVLSTAVVLVICTVVLNVLSANGKFVRQTKTEWEPPVQQEEIKVEIVDRSNNVKEMDVNEARINEPSIYGHEMLFSAGGGSLENSVLTNLYLFDAVSGTKKKIAESKLGEIYETFLSEDWIVWLDTDHKGKNVIYKMNRKALDGMEANTVSTVQETENHMPKLGLYGNYLIWMEQISDSEDKLYFVDLTSDENMALQLFDSTNYAVSAPYIYKNMVIWAEKDPDNEAISAIYEMIFEDLGEVKQTDEYSPEDEDDSGELEPEVFKTGTYVHKPICNDDIFAWIDRNNAPDSTLYYAYKSGAKEPVKFWNNVTQYSVGEDFIVFESNQIIYAYYYKSDVLVQVSESGKSAIMPKCFGTLVVWEDKTSTGGSDVFKYNVLG